MRWRFALFAALAAVWLWGVVPLSRGAASYVEESAGLVTVLPDWVGTGERTAVPVLGAQLITERRQPVGGILRRDGQFTPLMIDGHLGATSFLPFRWAMDLGGLDAARALSIASGLAVLAGVGRLALHLGSPLGAWLTMLLLATSPQFLFTYQWVRPDEQWSWAMPLAAALALHRHARTGRPGWLALAGLCLGCAVAAKLTVVVVLAAAFIAVMEFRLIAHLRPRDLLVLIASAVPPVLPQVAWTLLGDRRALDVRFANLPRLGTLLDRDRLAFFLRHFLDSFGGLGDYMTAALVGQPSVLQPLSVACGALFLAGLIACVALALCASTPVPQRAFGLALGVASLGYVAMYYQSMSLYLLLAPWVPLALGLVLARAWRPARARGLRQGLAVAVLILLAGNGIAQTRVLHRLVDEPQLDLMCRSVHEQLAEALVRAHVTAPWTTTHNLVGGLEIATAGQVRPHHAFEMFLQTVSQVGETTHGYDAAWDAVLREARRVAGPELRSDVVVQPAAAKMDANPLRHREWLAGRFPEAVVRQGGRIVQTREFRAAPQGPVLLTWVTVRWPAP